MSEITNKIVLDKIENHLNEAGKYVSYRNMDNQLLRAKSLIDLLDINNNDVEAIKARYETLNETNDQNKYDRNRYNGWCNYETGCIALWIDNEQYLYNRVRDFAIENGDKYDIKEFISELIDEENPLISDSTMYSDLLGAAISSANLYEIAEHWLAYTEEDRKANNDDSDDEYDPYGDEDTEEELEEEVE